MINKIEITTKANLQAINNIDSIAYYLNKQCIFVHNRIYTNQLLCELPQEFPQIVIRLNSSKYKFKFLDVKILLRQVKILLLSYCIKIFVLPTSISI